MLLNLMGTLGRGGVGKFGGRGMCAVWQPCLSTCPVGYNETQLWSLAHESTNR